MKILLFIILLTGIPYTPDYTPKRNKVLTHVPTGKVITYDRKEVNERGFAKIYLNGRHVLTCWDENLK